MDVVQSKRKYLADRNDIIADQASKTSAVLPAQSTDPIIAKLKVPVCNSICDVETADSASKYAFLSFIASSFISNEANDWMTDETTTLLDAWIPKEVGSPSISILYW